MFDAKPDSMPLAFGKLHLSVLLAGFTGVFGKLISLNEGLLVWYRLLITALLFGALLALGRRLPRVSLRDALRIGGVGVLLGLHWVFFYGSIKASNVSVGVVSFSTVVLPVVMSTATSAMNRPYIYTLNGSPRPFSSLLVAGAVQMPC